MAMQSVLFLFQTKSTEVGWQHTGHQKHLFQQEDTTSNCPFLCGAHEDQMHFCTCSADLAISHKTVHLSTLTNVLLKVHTSPSLLRALIESISSYCHVPVLAPSYPLVTSSRAQRITAAIATQSSLGMGNLLKGRVSLDLCSVQLEFFQRLPAKDNTTPDIQWRSWKTKLIKALVTFTLAIWNDRNSVVHGSSVSHSKFHLIAHVHKSVHNECARHASNCDSFMNPHFTFSKSDRLKGSLRTLRNWLQRVAASRVRLRLLHDAEAKLSTIMQTQYVDRESILSLSNHALCKWITSKFVPTNNPQQSLHSYLAA